MSRSSNPFRPPATRPARQRRPRRSRRTGRIIRVVGALVTGVAALVVVLVLINSSSTPEPQQIISQPDANSASLKDAERASLFDRFQFLQPATKVWTTGKSGDNWNMTYNDITSCNADAASCPTVSFINLDDPGAKAFFDGDPLGWWTDKNTCKTGETVLEGSDEFDTHDETTRYYRIPCGVEGEDTVHAWFIPGKNLFIFTSTGKGGTFSVEILKTVMDSVRWK